MTDDPRQAARNMIAAAIRTEDDTLSPGDDSDFDALTRAVLDLFPVVTWEDHNVDTSTLGSQVQTTMIQRALKLVGPIQYVETVERPRPAPMYCSCPATWSLALPSANDLGGPRPTVDPACPQHGRTA